MTVTEQLADVIALSVHAATAPLLAKIAVLEARPVVSLDVVDALKEMAADLRARLLAVEARAAVPGPAGPIGAAGEQGTPGPAGPIGPIGEKGVPGPVGERGRDGAPGKDGVAGKDGIDGIHGTQGVSGLDGKAGPEGPQGRDGRDGKDGAAGLNGRDGAPGLNGKDGADGLDGKDGAPGLNGKDGIDGLHGKDGAPGLNGKDGAPGLSPDDFDWDFNADTRELSLKLIRGGVVIDRTKALEGIRIYRGVYEAGRTYEKGDVTSWDGSEWTAMAQTKDRPGNGATAWKLTVKHGEKGAQGLQGKPGRDGKDLTQMDSTGRKWT